MSGKTGSEDRNMRLFVALPLAPRIAEELSRWTQAQRERLPFRKWTHPNDYHITLQFLGETSAAKADRLREALREIKAAPIPLTLDGAGTFGPRRAPRVLWAALSGDTQALASLHEQVIRSTSPLGFAPEDRPFASHITLARNFRGADDGMPEDALASAPAGLTWEADRFALMRTRLGSSPMYETVNEFPLHD